MTMTLLAWTLVLLWMSVPSETQTQEPVKVLYPDISSTASIECDGTNSDLVFWFRTSTAHNTVQFLVRSNNANKEIYRNNVDKKKFKINKRGSSFVLRIINVTAEDTGVYSCILKDKGTEVWHPGTLLLPGVVKPTTPSKITSKSNEKKDCKCQPPKSPRGCSSLILHTLVALLSVLTLAIILTLYYFSRLPKKCRHHFVKKKLGR